MINDVYINEIEWEVFTKRQLLPIKLLFGGCLLPFITEALIYHWWYMESRQLKKHMYGYKHYLK
jgi:hypothetical protein